MNIKLLIPCLAGLLCAACASNTPSTSTQTASATAAADKSVNVVFQNPEKFADVKYSQMDSDKDRDSLLDQLKEYITERAASRLADGQTFDVTIKEVDMAGDFEPWHARTQDVRIIKDIYPPRIDLDFKLTGANGKILAEGSRQLRDLSFMTNLISPTLSNDSLKYEKNLIDGWLSTEFANINKRK